jgi:hypothetical protein
MERLLHELLGRHYAGDLTKVNKNDVGVIICDASSKKPKFDLG